MSKKKSIEVWVLHQSGFGGGPCLSIDGNRVCWPNPSNGADPKYIFSLKISDLIDAVPGLAYSPTEEG